MGHARRDYRQTDGLRRESHRTRLITVGQRPEGRLQYGARPIVVVPAMKRALVFLVLVLAGCSSTGAVPDASSDASASITQPPAPLLPPAGSTPLCSGHVTGDPSGADAAPPHIIWEAFTTKDSVAKLKSTYTERLGPPTSAESPCFSWLLSIGGVKRAVEICPLPHAGPWDTCDSPPRHSKTVVLVSTMIEAAP